MKVLLLTLVALSFSYRMICAEVGPLPIAGVTAIAFTPDGGGQALVSDPAKLGQVLTAAIVDGIVIAGDDGVHYDWEIPQDAPFGKGILKIDLDRARITSDLAMVMNVHVSHESKIAVQLFGKEGAPLALDLFGDLKANAERATSDTFIIPLGQYPLATSVVIRRLSGNLRISEILLTPVISAVSSAPQLDLDLAKILGNRVDEFNRRTNRAKVTQGLTVRRIPSLAEINHVGAAALANAGYPRYRPLGKRLATAQFSPVSGTTYDFAVLADRLLSVEADRPLFDFYFTSSSGVHWFFPGNAAEATKSYPGSAEFGMCSIQMSADDRAKFLAKNGYPILEFPIARSAIEILVHEENPLTSLSSAQLAAAFGAENQALTWADLGLKNHPLSSQSLLVFGGNPDWGTGRMLREIALHGKPWRSDMDVGNDVVYARGVEAQVSKYPNAIGYAAQASRIHPVKVLAIEATGGGDPVYPTEEAIYSGKYPLQRKLYAILAAKDFSKASANVRELVNLILSDQGQTLMARTRNLPLAADEVVALRIKLGLP